jgi:hypothetical protein
VIDVPVENKYNRSAVVLLHLPSKQNVEKDVLFFLCVSLQAAVLLQSIFTSILFQESIDKEEGIFIESDENLIQN